jgi:uncharacterized protein YcbX
MLNVGKVKEIWRYPVKGMGGESVEAGTLTDKGIAGDRIWALRDSGRKEIQSCKFRPQLLLCTARTSGSNSTVEVTFPDGQTLRSDDPSIHSRLSELTGYDSTLEPLRPEGDTTFYRRYQPTQGTWVDELAATFDREPGEPLPDFSMVPQVLVDHVSVPGTFFLFTPMHFVTTASLRHLRSLHPGSDWNRRRFRPNLVIETNAGIDGLAEQAWVGRKLRVNEIAIDCVAGTPRCGAVTRAQPSLSADKAILRTIVKEADQNLGVYGVIGRGGAIRVGDAVFVE